MGLGEMREFPLNGLEKLQAGDRVFRYLGEFPPVELVVTKVENGIITVVMEVLGEQLFLTFSQETGMFVPKNGINQHDIPDFISVRK